MDVTMGSMDITGIHQNVGVNDHLFQMLDNFY